MPRQRVQTHSLPRELHRLSIQPISRAQLRKRVVQIRVSGVEFECAPTRVLESRGIALEVPNCRRYRPRFRGRRIDLDRPIRLLGCSLVLLQFDIQPCQKEPSGNQIGVRLEALADRLERFCRPVEVEAARHAEQSPRVAGIDGKEFPECFSGVGVVVFVEEQLPSSDSGFQLVGIRRCRLVVNPQCVS